MPPELLAKAGVDVMICAARTEGRGHALLLGIPVFVGAKVRWGETLRPTGPENCCGPIMITPARSTTTEVRT